MNNALMPCQLSRDQNGVYDAWGASGATATVFIRSDAAPTATVIAAHLDGASVPVRDDGKIVLTPLQRGTNVLTLVVEGTVPSADIQFVEDCAAAETLATKFVGDTPGGADPIVSFRIHGA
jgi:hypothetical protein